MAAPSIPSFTITHENGRGFVRVTAGSRQYLTTPMAAGLSLLGLTGEDAAATTEVEWDDHLATHGLAIGHVGPETLTLAVRPSMVRTVGYSRDGVTRQVPMTYPPTLTCLVTSRVAGVTRFVRGIFYCVKPAALASLSITTLDPVAIAFPYGNVYAEGRICWGGVATSGTCRTIAELEAAFYGSGFNGDLYHPASFATGAVNAFSTMMTRADGILPVPRDNSFNTNIPTIIARMRRG